MATYYVFMGVFVLACILDVVTTRMALEKGGIEANPIVRLYINNLSLTCVVTAVLIGIVGYLSYLLYLSDEFLFFIIMAPIIVVRIAIVANNYEAINR